MKLAIQNLGIESRHATRGFTLIECLVYISALGLIFAVGMSAFYRSRDCNRDLRRCADDISRAMQAGERWREDVRAATAQPTFDRTDEGQLLRVPQRVGDIVFYFKSDTVWRKSPTNTAWQVFLPRVVRSQMQADPRGRVAAWRWEVELASCRTNAQMKPLFTFQAVVAPEATR